VSEESENVDTSLRIHDGLKSASEKISELSNCVGELSAKKYKIETEYNSACYQHAAAELDCAKLSDQIDEFNGRKTLTTKNLGEISSENGKFEILIKREKTRMKNIEEMIETTSNKIENITVKSQLEDIGKVEEDETNVQNEIQQVDEIIIKLKCELAEEKEQGDSVVNKRYNWHWRRFLIGSRLLYKIWASYFLKPRNLRAFDFLRADF